MFTSYDNCPRCGKLKPKLFDACSDCLDVARNEERELDIRLRNEAKLRDFHERVFLAAVASVAHEMINEQAVIEHAHSIALEALRQYPQITAERDAQIRQIVEG